MKILYDLSSAQMNGDVKINGGGEYSLSIFDGLMKAYPDLEVIVLLREDLSDSEKLKSIIHQTSCGTKRIKDIKDIETIIVDEKINEVVFPVCYFQYSKLNIPNDVKIVSVIHDLCDVFYDNTRIKYGRFLKNDGRNWGRWIKLYIHRKRKKRQAIAEHNRLMHINENQLIITDSEYTKATMQYYLDIDSSLDIRVLYAAPKLEKEKNVIVDVFDKYGAEKKKFFLLTAGCRWAKNNAIVIKAFDNIFNEKKYEKLFAGFKVILIGNSDESVSFYKKMVRNVDRFIFDNYVSEDELTILYENAYSLIFPSVIEGFGMPPIEAMKRGTLPICSTAMSIPEICKQGAIYFDPYDIENIIHILIESMESSFYESACERAKIRYEEIEKKRYMDKETTINLIADIKV